MDEKRMLAKRYELIRKIGSGGMAVVYQAYDTLLDRQVAIKLLRDEYADDPDFLRRFQKEAQAVARLSHQNIVNIYDFGNSDDVTYLVMEYVEGSTLKEIIAQYGPLPLNQVIDYSVQICYGLAQAHSQQIVHKDIKPHNIMIDRNHVVKITDFGIAQAMNNLTITHNKGILGSAHYFSPEQARGDHVDFESDIYSLGIVMYEMLTGHVPFTGDNPVTVALKHMQEQPPSITAQRDDVPVALEHIIFRALEKKPVYRFPSMQAMADALLDLQLAMEDRGYAGREVVYQPVECTYETAEEDQTRPKRHAEQQTDDTGDGSTRVMKHSYLQDISGKKRTKKRNVILLVAAAIVLFFGSFWAVQGFLGHDEVEVPALTNKTVLEAEALLSESSLKIKVEDETYSSEVEKDHIISQLPKEGMRVKEGREIAVVVSLGSNEVDVPDVRGMSEQAAKIALENAGLEPGNVTKVTDSQQPADVVVYQSVEPETSVEPGTQVDLMINEKEVAPAVVTVKVPAMTGKTLDEARKLLAAANLKEGAISKTSSDAYYSDYVVQQGTASGSEVPEGTAINLIVSTGPGPSQSAQFELIIPEDGVVVATLQDAAGTSKLYQKDCVAGERVQQSFLYHGKATVTITCNGQEIWSQEY